MDERQNAIKDNAPQTGSTVGDSFRDGREPGIGQGKRTALYGCSFVLLGIVLVAIIIYLTGIYAPFEGSEGVGP